MKVKCVLAFVSGSNKTEGVKLTRTYLIFNVTYLTNGLIMEWINYGILLFKTHLF